MQHILETLGRLGSTSGFTTMTVQQLIMIVIACVLLYLGLVKKFEPLLLVGIAFGALLTNLPGSNMYHPEMWDAYIAGTMGVGQIIHEGGLLDILYIGVKSGLYPSLMMTDFGPLIANPRSLLLGAAAQFGIFAAFLLALGVFGFEPNVAASIGIIGGADGPTAIWLTSKLAPNYLAPIAIAAYSYMALIPLIQPPFMRLLTTKEEREIKMEQLRPVSKTQKVLFPIIVTIFVCLLLPSVAPLLGCLMLGNLFKECGLTDQHRHDLPFHLRGRHGGCGALPRASHAVHHPARSGRVHLRHDRRPSARKAHVQALRRQDQPPHRFRRRVRCSDGGPRQPDGGRARESFELPADARHGPERGRRHRFRRRGRLPARGLRRLNHIKRSLLKSADFF